MEETRENTQELDKFVPAGGWKINPSEQSDAQFDMNETLRDFVAIEQDENLTDPVILVPLHDEHEEVVSTCDGPEPDTLPQSVSEFDPVRVGEPFLSVDSEIDEWDSQVEDSVEFLFDVMDLAPVRIV